jgi:hypothetical protein
MAKAAMKNKRHQRGGAARSYREAYGMAASAENNENHQ